MKRTLARPRRLSGENTPRVCVAVAAVGLVLAGCGGSPPVAVDQPLADAARVVCQPDGPADISPAAVRAHRDGVHLRVDSPAEGEGMLLSDEWGYEPVPPGVNDLVLSVPPGEHRLTCVTPLDTDDPEEVAWPYPSDDEWAALPTLTVVDVEGVWADRTLACDHPTGYHHDYEWDMTDAPVPPGSKGALVDLAREDLPRELGEDGVIRRGDELGLAGYPDATSTVRLARGGTVVALISYQPDGQGGWHLGGVEYCE
jgi:hypothetical protein